MTWRGLIPLLLCVPAFAQLPRPQAPPPREGPIVPRLDAVVTDDSGRPVEGLTAADFTIEVDGKPRKIETCAFQKDGPLRLAVVIDDLSLPLDRLNAAKRALRAFVAHELRPGDEMAIARTSTGSGAADGFTAERQELDRAIDRARYNLASEEPTAESFAAGALSVLRGAVEGLATLPGRKAVLLVSHRLRGATVDERLSKLAHRAATVIYGFDTGGPASGAALELGLAAAAKATGGRLFDSGELGAALSRVAQDARGYYLLTYRGEDLPYDYIARTPRADGLTLKSSRAGAIVRARDGIPGEPDGAERELSERIDSELDGDEVETKVTALLSVAGTSWQVETVVHVEARDLVFVQGKDGLYRATVETYTALFDHTGTSVRDATRGFQTQLTRASYERYKQYGFDYTVVLPVSTPGVYQARALVRDGSSGRVGSARQFLKVAEWKDRLVMSSIVARGETEKDADGVESAKDPLESGTVRSFKQGHKLLYAYNLYNVAADTEKRSTLETRTELWRDGVRVLATEPRVLTFPAAENASQRSVSGTIILNESVAPGVYLLRVSVTDKLNQRTAWQAVDFEVRP